MVELKFSSRPNGFQRPKSQMLCSSDIPFSASLVVVHKCAQILVMIENALLYCN